MPTSTGLAVTVGKGYAGYSPGGGAPPPDVEHVVNGDFGSATNWTLGSNWAIAAGVATNSGGTVSTLTNLLSPTPLTNGGTYTMTFTITASNNADDVTVYANTSNSTVGAQLIYTNSATVGAKTSGPVIATGAWTHLIMQNVTNILTIDNVSLIGP